MLIATPACTGSTFTSQNVEPPEACWPTLTFTVAVPSTFAARTITAESLRAVYSVASDVFAGVNPVGMMAVSKVAVAASDQMPG